MHETKLETFLLHLLVGATGHNLTGIASQFAMHLGFTCDVISVTHPVTSDTSFGPDQMEEGVHAWTSPCNPDPLKPGVKLMAGCNSAGVGVTSVSLPVVNSYVSKTCDKEGGCYFAGLNSV